MHTEMWEHPATRANVAVLRERGAVVLDPASGRLTGTDTGPGRLPEAEQIFAAVTAVLRRAQAGRPAADLAGRHVLVSAGGTREPLDPVRFLGNRSSGRQGYALAATAAARGATVTLVSANSELPAPAGVDVVPVGTARQLREAVLGAAPGADVVVMAAAVSDFRPAVEQATKIKKSPTGDDAPAVQLVRNPDVLAEISATRLRPGQVVVGFAAETGDETGDVLTHARAKLARKGCDLLVVNEVGGDKAFATPDNTVVLLDAAGGAVPVGPASKEHVADAVWDAVRPLLQ
jgi:phosphopantothenoylcysteine decarboxylase/phosphopantothenate--cysteine ligase